MTSAQEPSVAYRVATVDDAATLQAIYAPYLDTTITFEYVVPTVEEFAHRIEHYLERYPYIVCEVDGRVAGYAYASELYERTAYDWAAELSVYFDPAFHGLGLGTKLYTKLIELLAAQGFRTVHGKVTSPNPKSDRMHDRMGFSLAGTQHRSGYKFGEWLDVNLYEKSIGSFDGEPDPVIPFPNLDPAIIARILEQ